MYSKAFLALGLFIAVFLLIFSEVAARDLAKETAGHETAGLEDVKYGGPGGGYGGYPGGGRGGGYPGGGRGGGYPGGGRGGYGRGCRYGCCRGGGYYHGRGCQCCSYAGEEPEMETAGKPHN